MSGFTSFAIAGAGGIGFFIVEELLKLKASNKVKNVVVLTRSAKGNPNLDTFASKGATITVVDYSSPSSLTTALSGIDVVISAVAMSGMDIQFPLADAAKSAGVKLFVPTEFGNPTDDPALINEKSPLATKAATQKKLKDLGLPYALFFTGPFSDFCFIPLLGLDIENGKAIVGGDGNTPISWTARPDIARFLVYVLTELPPSKLEWAIFRIEGERASFNQIFAAYERKTGKKIDITYKSAKELQDVLASNPQDVLSYLQLAWSLGKGQVGKPEQVSNGLYPDWHPKNVLDVLAP